MDKTSYVSQEGASYFQLFSLRYIEDSAIQLLERLPQNLFEKLAGLKIQAENFATESTLNGLKIQNRYDLLGLYRGVPFFKKKESDGQPSNDTLFLYRAPIIRYTQEYKENIDDVIEQIILHEIGHHFMISKSELILALAKKNKS
jgi:predicted Zn-dependent protease with MMP-like domain